MDRVTRAFYATSAAALLSVVAMAAVMLVASAPGSAWRMIALAPHGGAPASVVVGDVRMDVRAG